MGQKPSQLGNANRKLPIPWTLKASSNRQPLAIRETSQTKIQSQQKPTRNAPTGGKENGFAPSNRNNASSAIALRGGNLRAITSVTNDINKANQGSAIKNTNVTDVQCKVMKSQNAPVRTKSEPNLAVEKKDRHKHRRKSSSRSKCERNGDVQQFGYEIEDVDEFLANASIDKPANIPVVLASPSVLYQTRVGGYQAEISLPLGMVVNAVFKNQHWLYVQTPHAEEGYVSYAVCLPLGIIPPPENSLSPCWENSTDVFPRPSGNATDTEKLSSRSDCGGAGARCRSRSRCRGARPAAGRPACGERSVDRLYLRAAAGRRQQGATRRTLLVVRCDYAAGGRGGDALAVRRGDVVALVGAPADGWFRVRDKDGAEGVVPAAVAGHGFL